MGDQDPAQRPSGARQGWQHPLPHGAGLRIKQAGIDGSRAVAIIQQIDVHVIEPEW